MLKFRDALFPSKTAESSLQQLQERVAELEGENAALHQLQETVRRNSRIFKAMLSKSHEGFLLVTPQLTFSGPSTRYWGIATKSWWDVRCCLKYVRKMARMSP